MAKMEFDRSVLEAALVGYEAERARIDAVIAGIRAQLGKRGPGRPKGNSNKSAPTAGKRTMSAAASRRIAAAQKKRWAAYRKEEKQVKPKRQLSAAGRKAIVDALKRRWAAKRKSA